MPLVGSWVMLSAVVTWARQHALPLVALHMPDASFLAHQPGFVRSHAPDAKEPGGGRGAGDAPAGTRVDAPILGGAGLGLGQPASKSSAARRNGPLVRMAATVRDALCDHNKQSRRWPHCPTLDALLDGARLEGETADVVLPWVEGELTFGVAWAE